MPIDIEQLYRQHPVAVVGVVGGVALAGAYMLSKRGKAAATYPVAPFAASGSGSGMGYGIGTSPPHPLCWVTGECPEPPGSEPGGDPHRRLPPIPTPSYPTTPPVPYCLPDGGYTPQGVRIPPCGRPAPLPGPELPEGGGEGAGFGGDFAYMRALDTVKRGVGMRINPWT